MMMFFSETETPKQNQKISFPFLFPLRGGGVGGETREKCKEIFGFCTRESASVSEVRKCGTLSQDLEHVSAKGVPFP